MDYECRPMNTSSSVRNLFEPDHINMLLRHRLRVQRTNRIPPICVYQGDFVPIHADHVGMMREAKRYVEKLGTHEFLGTYVSPSHAGSVAKELNSAETIGVGHRLSMIYLAIEQLDWAMLDHFEIFQPCNTKPLVIMKAFLSRVRSQLFNRTRIDVFWLTDHKPLAQNRPPDEWLGLGFHVICVIPRIHNDDLVKPTNQYALAPGYHEERWRVLRSLSAVQQRSAKMRTSKSRLTTAFNFRFHMAHATHMNHSSSVIRACARNSATEYILKHHLWRTSANTVPVIGPDLFDRILNDTNVTLKYLSHMLSVYSNESVHVTSFQQQQIGIGTGFASIVNRFYDVRYSSNSPDHLPTSMVLKIPHRYTKRRTAHFEHKFYLNIASRIGNVNIPKWYYVAGNSDADGTRLLLLEDLSVKYQSFAPTEWMRDSTFYAVVTAIASLHAEFFQHPMLGEELFTWLPSLNSTLPLYQKEYAFSMAHKFAPLLKSNASTKAVIYASRLLEQLPYIFRRLSDEHYTLSHNDLWMNNVLSRRGGRHELMILDWQTCTRANGLIDVAFVLRFRNGALARFLEPQALRIYHQTLVKHGVSHYSMSEIREDYYSLALPFLFIRYFSFMATDLERVRDMLMMLEDIVTQSKKNK